ncbi:MAG TPA: PPC domain-containing DNA-binding protein [Terriglobales bacterium]|nr:PPC domain-containing DNA-binding protein [Terriglobales bacterium]
MQYKKFGTTYVIRLEVGEEIIDSLRMLVEEEKIKGGFFYGLGAVRSVSLGYFDVERKQYKEKSFNRDFELTSMIGDVALSGDKIIVHAHVTLAGMDFRAVAGHLNKATVTATTEIVFNPIEGKLSKKIDPISGLNLMDLKD